MKLLVLLLVLAGIARGEESCPLYHVASSGSVAHGRLELALYQNSRVWLNGTSLHTRGVSSSDPYPEVSLKPGDVLTTTDRLLWEKGGSIQGRRFERFRLDALTPITASFIRTVRAAVPEELGNGACRFHLGTVESTGHFQVELKTFCLIYEELYPGVLVGEPTKRTK